MTLDTKAPATEHTVPGPFRGRRRLPLRDVPGGIRRVQRRPAASGRAGLRDISALAAVLERRDPGPDREDREPHPDAATGRGTDPRARRASDPFRGNQRLRPRGLAPQHRGECQRPHDRAARDFADGEQIAFVDMPYRMAAEQPEHFAQYLIQAIARGGNLSTYIMGAPGRIPYANLPTVREITQFHKRNRALYAALKPGSTIAVARPNRLRSASPGYPESVGEFCGVYTSLQEAHLPFDPIDAGLIAEMAAEGNLARYSMVILPDLGRAWPRRGGGARRVRPRRRYRGADRLKRHRRARGDRRGRHPHRRPGGERPGGEKPGHRDGVPGLRALPAYVGRREHSVCPEADAQEQGRDR
jgi:hypothetical protein